MSDTVQRLTYTNQHGKPGACYLAQIFDANGKAVATIDATQDPAQATERARRMAACWNACIGIDTVAIQALVTLHDPSAHQIASIAAEELVRSEGESTGAPDTYAIPQCQADDHMRACIAYLVRHGMASSHESSDGYIAVMFIDDATAVEGLAP
jgi:hypothetical protein